MRAPKLAAVIGLASMIAAEIPDTCSPDPACTEDENCADLPAHAGADVFALDCDRMVSDVWPGAPSTLIRDMCGCSCAATSSCAESTNAGIYKTVPRIALGNDRDQALETFTHYFKNKLPVILTDEIAKSTMAKWGLRAQKKTFGNEAIVVTVQPDKWIDDRDTNFHAVHQYLQSDIDVKVNWGGYIDLLRSKERSPKSTRKIAASESWRDNKKAGVKIDWRTAEVHLG
jgi:hypothetical protein